MNSVIDALSKRAPSIVVFTLCASLMSALFDSPSWLPAAAGIAVGGLALLLLAARGRGQQVPRGDDPDSTENRTWLAWELAGKGTPPGFYLLCFFGFLTLVLTGFQSPHGLLAWAGVGLTVAWGVANRSYPIIDVESP